MISFIIIGKNEGERLRKCLDSIIIVAQQDKLKSWEIIYVDSKSTDSSIAIAKGFPRVNVYLITGVCNAAIARNIGAKEANGEILYFIDGDMEILPGFLPKVTKDEVTLEYEFISGRFMDIVYDSNWNYLYSSSRMKNTQCVYESVVGGLFVISKQLWKQIGGMDTRQKRSQDYDLGLRLTSHGTPLLRYPDVIARHHMVEYSARSEYVKYVKYTALLLRKHITNKHYLPVFVGQHYTSLVLIISLILAFAVKWWMIGLYILSLCYKIISATRRQGKNTIHKHYIFNLMKRDICIWFYFIFCFDKQVTEEYTKV